jgi:hypothetical protein
MNGALVLGCGVPIDLHRPGNIAKPHQLLLNA